MGSPFWGTVVQCMNCGLAFMTPMPEDADLADYYERTYWVNRQKNKSPTQYRRCPRASAQIMMILDHLKPMTEKPFSILEIGAGEATPSLLLRDRLSKRGEVVISVIEPGEEWKAYYDAVGVRFLDRLFSPKLKGRYTHIHASHWLEHVTSPSLVVQTISGLLEEGGTVFVEVPFAANEYWVLPLADTPHTLFFSIESLQRLFEMNGFVTVLIGRYGIDLSRYARHEWPSDEEFALKNDNGFWIRGLFKKRIK